MNETNKAKMISLLALLDVLHGRAEMTSIGADRVGGNDAHGRAGKIRLRFTVFGNEDRLLKLAAELTETASNEELMRILEQLLDRDERLKFAARMIETWSEVMQRLLASTLRGIRDQPSGHRRIAGEIPMRLLPVRHWFECGTKDPLCTCGQPREHPSHFPATSK